MELWPGIHSLEASLTWNEDLARRSIARMATLGVELLLPGHGTPIDDGARRCAELVATK
jgi:hypothetical protein